MKRILIVDDDESVLIRLEHLLEAEGYGTTTAWSGREAILLARLHQFDLLLIDERLNDLDSTILVKELREMQPRASLLLMHTSEESAGLPTNGKVCKWRDEQVRTFVRSLLAA